MEIEEMRERALKLADIIASSEERLSKEIYEATKELKHHLKKLDGKTQKEIMERIRGFS